jgi:hypothetical protein
MTQSISTNTFGVARFVVSADPTQGTHTTIATALTSASSGDNILIREGSYPENLTLKSGVALIGLGGSGAVVITGKATMSVVGTARLQGLLLATNSDNVLVLSGANASAVIVENCYFSCTSGTGISVNNNTVGSGVLIYDSQVATTSTNAFFAVTTGVLLLNGVFTTQDTALSSTASTIAAGTLDIRNCYLSNTITGTGGTINIANSTLDQLALNGTALTVNGATVNSQNNVYLAGSASGITVTSGTMNSYNDTVNSSNTNAVTGAGTINYSGMIFSGSSSTINTTTQSGGIAQGVKGGVAPASGFIGFTVSASQTTPQVLTSATVFNVTSVSIPAGRWAVYGASLFTSTGVNTTNVSLITALQTVNNSVSSLEGSGFATATLAGVGLMNFSGAQSNANFGPYILNLTTPTTYFLNVEAVAAVAFNMSVSGTIRAVCIG